VNRELRKPGDLAMDPKSDQSQFLPVQANNDLIERSQQKELVPSQQPDSMSLEARSDTFARQLEEGQTDYGFSDQTVSVCMTRFENPLVEPLPRIQSVGFADSSKSPQKPLDNIWPEQGSVTVVSIVWTSAGNRFRRTTTLTIVLTSAHPAWSLGELHCVRYADLRL
jgi:hypothetical protein